MAILLLNKRVSEKCSVSGQNVMDDLKLKDSKSGVFCDFERNAVGNSYILFLCQNELASFSSQL